MKITDSIVVNCENTDWDLEMSLEASPCQQLLGNATSYAQCGSNREPTTTYMYVYLQHTAIPLDGLAGHSPLPCERPCCMKWWLVLDPAGIPPSTGHCPVPVAVEGGREREGERGGERERERDPSICRWVGTGFSVNVLTLLKSIFILWPPLHYTVPGQVCHQLSKQRWQASRPLIHN